LLICNTFGAVVIVSSVICATTVTVCVCVRRNSQSALPASSRPVIHSAISLSVIWATALLCFLSVALCTPGATARLCPAHSALTSKQFQWWIFRQKFHQFLNASSL